MPLPAGIRGVLMDVEGTTTSLSFVLDVLYPYSEARLAAVCARPGPEAAGALALLRAEYETEPDGARRAGLPPFGDGAPYARYLLALDRKSTGLKALQGLIWEEGYASGELRGHLFADVPPALEAWSAAGIALRVFSSGSVRAQELLFGHTDYGVLSPLFDGFHDTLTGPKLEPASYRRIAEAFGEAPGEPAARLLFLSDTLGELDAAAAAGLRTGCLVRPGNRPQPPHSHPTFTSFGPLVG
jgi:enolase-phosphatase E1